jgi:hypothetical protein
MIIKTNSEESTHFHSLATGHNELNGSVEFMGYGTPERMSYEVQSTSTQEHAENY